MLHSEEKFTRPGSTDLYYQAWRPAGDPRAVIVGVHGHGDHSGGLRNLVQHLVPQGFAWYGLDLRGHGRSPGLRGHVSRWADFTDDLAAFIDLVAGREAGKRLFLVGHSMGGLISLDFALLHPERLNGVAAICPPLVYAGMSPAMMALVRALSYVAPRFTVTEKPDYTKLTRDPEVTRVLAADPLRHAQATAALGRELMAAQSRVNAGAATLRVPLLLQQGLADPVTPAAGAQRFFGAITAGDKRLAEYEGSPHRPFDDVNRAAVLADLSEWLAQQTR